MTNSQKKKKELHGRYTRLEPCHVLLKERVLLTSPNSSKQTYHIALNLEGSDLQFEPGDSLGILPQNDPALAGKLLSLLHVSPNEPIINPRTQEEMTSLDYLLQKVNFSRVNSSLIQHFCNETTSSIQKERLSRLLEKEHKEELQAFLQGKDIVDIIELLCEGPTSLQEFAQFFTPLLPRFYSISSSLKAHSNEVHLLVALLSYPHGNELRYGVAGNFLCNLAEEGRTKIPLYVQPADHFRLPKNLSQDIIMIGPGTGVAPYRAFLQERIHQEASGRNWLFFGERNSDHDFHYKSYLTLLQDQGKLKLDTAFSRDQEHKEYVQHKITAKSDELWDWISNGAAIYVCGDASKMAKDVEATLLAIIEDKKGLSEADARAYLKAMRASHQYLTDVY